MAFMNADWVKFVNFVVHIVTGPHSRCLLVMSFAFVIQTGNFRGKFFDKMLIRNHIR